MEYNRVTGALRGFGMTFLSAPYKLFLTSFITSVFNPQAPFCMRLTLNQRQQE